MEASWVTVPQLPLRGLRFPSDAGLLRGQQTRLQFEGRFELLFPNETYQWDASSCYLKSS